MKVLLDACTPVQVRRALPDHDVRTAAKMGWGAFANGELLRVAEQRASSYSSSATRTCAINKTWRVGGFQSSNSWTNHRPTLERHLTFVRSNAEAMKPGEYRAIEPPPE